jgi:hypothetical protein
VRPKFSCTGCDRIRQGVEISRSTLAGWVGASSDLLSPLVDAIQKHVLAGCKLHADDTPMPVLAPGNGKTRTGRLWTYVRDDRPAGEEATAAVWFAYSEDRNGEHPRQHLKNFKGALQADAYAGFHHLNTVWSRNLRNSQSRADGETRNRNDLCGTCFGRGHPTRKQMSRSVYAANEQVGDSVVLVFTRNNEALISERMKRVGDGDFASQNSGIMNCLPTAAANAPQRCTA